MAGRFEKPFIGVGAAVPDSANFSTDRLSLITTSDEEAAADLEIIREEPLDYADKEDGDGPYQYDYTDFTSENSQNDEDESDSYDDSYYIDQIMADRSPMRAVDIGYAHRGAATDRNLPLKLHDQDTDDVNYRRPKRHGADLRPPRASHEDTGGGTSSSQRTSQPGHSIDEVPYD